MGTERRHGKPYVVETGWGNTELHQHSLEVHRTSDLVTYTADGTNHVFTVEQFEELMRMASTIDYLKQPTAPRTIITTEAELTELLADDERTVILTDVGGFIWWSEYTSAAGNLLVGCAQPADAGWTIGQTVPGWMNVMRPNQAIGYGPFTLIKDSHEEQQ